VELINARTRKSVFEDSILDARVLDIAAAPSGRIAYLVRVGSERYLYVARNRRAMLDSASGPELRGLRVVRGRLTWVSGGGRQAYPFR
jgi:hypothetical protein